MFDTMFFHVFDSLVQSGEYDFLKLAFYIDKHYISPKRTGVNSVFLFLVPCPDSKRDFSIIVADVSTKRFVIYDPLEGSASYMYAKTIDSLRTFVGDYIDNFQIQDNVDSEIEEDEEPSLLKIEEFEKSMKLIEESKAHESFSFSKV